MEEKSPYLEHPKRLADVIAAIQFLGSHKYGSRSMEKWAAYIGSAPKSAGSWNELFEQHPEFFRINEGYVALVWRRARPKNYHRERDEILTKSEIAELSDEDRNNVTWRPLEPSQIEALLNSAIQMHASAIAHKQELRWWIPVIAALLGTVLGAVLKG